MDINYLDKIIKKISQYNDEDLISSVYWDIIYNNLYLTHELLKLNQFKLFTEIKPDFFQEDIICLDLLGYSSPPYHYIPQKYINSDSFWIHALELNHTYVSKIPEKFLQDNKNLCFWICEKFDEYSIMQYFPDSLKKDFDLAYFAINSNPDNFKYLSSELKDNPYLYELIFKKKSIKSSDYFKLAGTKIRSNYKFAKKSIIENPSSFFSLDDSLKNDSGFFLEMLNYSDNILKFANKTIKSNEFCITVSIEKNPLSIEFADSFFKSSLDFVISIHDNLKNYPNFVEFAKLLDSELFSNSKFVDIYFQQISDSSCYYLLGNNIVNDYDIMKKFVLSDVNAFKSASNSLKNNIEFIKDCYQYYNKKNNLQQFNIESQQSSIFNMLEDTQLNDISFLQDLYQEFKPIFKDVVFPIIQKKKTILTDLLSNELNIETGLHHLLDKFELKNKLENQLQNSIKNKNKKI